MAELNDHSARGHALLSASSSSMWINCPRSAMAQRLYADEATVFTQEGTIAHEVAEAVLNKKPIAAGPDVTEEMIRCAEAYRDYILELIRQPVEGSILVECQVDYSEYAPGGYGTCDCILIQDGTLDIIDYKFGKGVPVSAEGNSQMRLYALGAIHDYGMFMGAKTVTTHIFQPRINNVSSETVSVEDLTRWGVDTVRPAALLAAEGEGEYKAGKHCRWCKHAGACRALYNSCVKTYREHGTEVQVQCLRPDEVAEILDMEGQITMWLKKVKALALAELMEGEEIPGYKVVEGKQGLRKWTNEDDVVGALQAAGYGLDEITETHLLSPAGLDKAIGKKKVAELLADHIERSKGAPTIVPMSDKRAPYDPAAAFEKLD